MTEVAFYSLWKPLLGYAVSRGIDKDAAQDLVMESIYAVIERYDPSRGDMLPYAYRVLGNRIKNYYRDANKHAPLTADVTDDAPTPYDYAVMREETVRAEHVLAVLRLQLDHTEVRLLNILHVQMEADGKYNVSVAARAIDIEPLKAHDMLRKIKRKLRGMETVKHMYVSEAPSMLHDMMDESAIVRESRDVSYSIKPSFEESFDSLLRAMAGLEVFALIAARVQAMRLKGRDA